MGLNRAGLVPAAKRERDAVPLKDLVQFAKIGFKVVVVIDIERLQIGCGHDAFAILDQHELRGGAVAEGLLGDEASAHQQGVRAGRPLMVPSAHHDGLLAFVEMVIGPCVGGVVVLEVVAGVIVLVFDEHQGRVLRGDLLLHRGVPFDVVQAVIRPDATVVLKIEVEGIAGPAKRAELRDELGNGLVVRAGQGRTGETQSVGLKQAGVLFLGDMLRKAAAANRRQEVCQQEFIKPYRFVAEVETGRVAQFIVTVGKEQVRRGVRVIIRYRPGRFSQAHVLHARVAVNRCQVGAAHRPVLIQQQPGPKKAAIVVAFLRGLQVANRFVDLVLPLLEQRQVKPAGRIVRVQLARQFQLFVGLVVVVLRGIGLAQVTAQQGPLRFQRRCHQQILQTPRQVPTAYSAKTTAQPCVA